MEIARSIVSRLRQYVGDRRYAKRVVAHLPFTISLAGPSVSSNGSKRISTTRGHTLDLSVTGLALIVPSIIVGEHHLVSENRHLNVRLELPDGPIEMRVTPIRYERLDEHETETGYLVGVKIIAMEETDKTRFNDHIAQLLRE